MVQNNFQPTAGFFPTNCGSTSSRLRRWIPAECGAASSVLRAFFQSAAEKLPANCGEWQASRSPTAYFFQSTAEFHGCDGSRVRERLIPTEFRWQTAKWNSARTYISNRVRESMGTATHFSRRRTSASLAWGIELPQRGLRCLRTSSNLGAGWASAVGWKWVYLGIVVKR
jgi:hypothetical protein